MRPGGTAEPHGSASPSLMVCGEAAIVCGWALAMPGRPAASRAFSFFSSFCFFFFATASLERPRGEGSGGGARWGGIGFANLVET